MNVPERGDVGVGEAALALEIRSIALFVIDSRVFCRVGDEVDVVRHEVILEETRVGDGLVADAADETGAMQRVVR